MEDELPGLKRAPRGLPGKRLHFSCAYGRREYDLPHAI